MWTVYMAIQIGMAITLDTELIGDIQAPQFNKIATKTRSPANHSEKYLGQNSYYSDEIHGPIFWDKFIWS